jgi:hypothetical protein
VFRKPTFVLKFPQGPVPKSVTKEPIEEFTGGLHGGAAGLWAEGGADNVVAPSDQTQQDASGGFSEAEKGAELSQEEAMSSAELKRALEEIGDEEEVSKEVEGSALGVEQLAAIPEASLDMSSARRSKRRDEDADLLVGLSAEHRKALRNEGMLLESGSVSFPADSELVSNLESIGSSLGHDVDNVRMSVSNLKSLASVNLVEKEVEDKKAQVVERDEQDRLEEDELDKMF